ncbi:MAG: M36 family metallopeptidase [Rubricoccaceae bacterium]|nr:M36 family metallopeptidase [Rubricoccaceae bacterium]
MRRATFLFTCVIALSWPPAAGAQQLGETPTYRVYPIPVESPAHTEPLPPADARVLLDDPSHPTASPFGWHDVDGSTGADFTTTQGNNVVAYYDVNGNGQPDEGELADGGSELAFDFPIDLENPPFESADAVLTNLFYWANAFHDILYLYGFDEASGNAQQNNYGNGGIGGDPILIEGRDTSSGVTTNVPPDGGNPKVIVSLLDTPPFGAIALDNWSTVHLLAHLASLRMTGGAGTTGCLSNEEQMGEGWSDWYGLMFTMRTEDTRNTLRRDNGFRPAPYTTDFAINDYTYGDTQTQAIPFGVGFVWATILWEVTWDLIDAHGFDADIHNATGAAGNIVAMRLVTEAMKHQPCSPGFVDARDAILLADQLLYGGAYEDMLWEAFARRGLGFSASQGSSNTNADNVEAFDTPLPNALEDQVTQAALSLESLAPNPVHDELQIGFYLASAEHLRLTVYDTRGRTVAVLAEHSFPAGRHELRLNTLNMASGLYILRAETSASATTRQFAVAH